MARDDLKWKEVIPGHWQRPLDHQEWLFSVVANLTGDPAHPHWNLGIGAVLPKDKGYAVEAVRDAWKALRYQHPNIAATVQDNHLHYDVIKTKDELEAWLAETFKVEGGDTPGRKVSGKVPPPPNKAVLYFLPDAKELFILQTHDRLDAIGALMLLNNLLVLIDSPKQVEFGDEHKNLTPSMAEVLDVQLVGEGSEAEKYAQKLMGKYASQPIIGLATKVPLAYPEGSNYQELQFSEEDTAAYLQACKSRNITITHAVQAAVALGIRSHGHIDAGNYTDFLSVNMRPRFPAPYNTPAHPSAVYLTATVATLPVSAGTDFMDLSNQVKAGYEEWKSDLDNVKVVEPFAKMYTGMLKAIVASATPTPASICFSSLGVLEKYITQPVEDVWLNATVQVPSVTLHGFTIKNRLRLTLCYNTVYLDKESIDRFFQYVKENLDKGLGISRA